MRHALRSTRTRREITNPRSRAPILAPSGRYSLCEGSLHPATPPCRKVSRLLYHRGSPLHRLDHLSPRTLSRDPNPDAAQDFGQSSRVVEGHSLLRRGGPVDPFVLPRHRSNPWESRRRYLEPPDADRPTGAPRGCPTHPSRCPKVAPDRALRPAPGARRLPPVRVRDDRACPALVGFPPRSRLRVATPGHRPSPPLEPVPQRLPHLARAR